MSRLIYFFRFSFIAYQIRISEILPDVRYSFLAQWIRISEILAWGRNHYHTHVILPKLSHVDFVGCIGSHAHDHQVMSLFGQSDIMQYYILVYSWASESLY